MATTGGKWEKGKSGNPKGRPKKGKTLTDVLEKYGRELKVKTEGNKTISGIEALAVEAWKLALDGDITAIKYIYDRIDGRPKETHELTGADGDSLGLEIRYV